MRRERERHTDTHTHTHAQKGETITDDNSFLSFFLFFFTILLFMHLKDFLSFRSKKKDDIEERRKRRNYLCLHWPLSSIKKRQPKEREEGVSHDLLSQCIGNALSMHPDVRHKRTISMTQPSTERPKINKQRRASLPVYLGQLETIPEDIP